jgi:hypothetical protein
MAAQVTVFNASAQNLTIAVNGGSQIALPGTNGEDYDWGPYPLIGSVTYQPGNPRPGVLGNIGINAVQACLEAVPIGGSPFIFALPTHTIFGSIEIYFFFQTVQAVSWLVLIDGKPIAQQITLHPAVDDHHVPRERP